MQNRQLSPTLATLFIINLVCLLIFTTFQGYQLSAIENKLALHLFNSNQFIPFQYITYMFLHANMGHFLSNMLGLLLFGTLLEKFWGEKRFLIFYLITGIGGGIVFSLARYVEHYELFKAMDLFLNNPTPDLFDAVYYKYYRIDQSLDLTDLVRQYYKDASQKDYCISLVAGWKEHIAGAPCVGASGAVFGLLFAFAYLFPNTELSLMFLPITLPAKFFVLFYGAYELFFGIYKLPGDRVAHWGHLGGVMFGYLVLYIWQKSRKSLF
ncbi:MAG TPA: rhomboid family intramembrane serine protease [Cytophagales bacterium]|nr:rhomboid family intramembrane serine protease [Cytophagales bacterium]